ncbi:MAG: diamine N-acetyltransferase [Colwellia polaris]|jgi:diamine N-acetyltransferase
MKTVFKQDGDITLRPLEVDDAEFLHEIINHNDVRAFLSRAPTPVSLESQKEYIREETSKDNYTHFLIEYKGEKAGHIYLGSLENDYRRSSVGYSVHPDFQEQEICSKALKLVVEYAFETLNRHKIKGGYIDGNEASRRVMEKSGFQKEGVERDFKYVDGEWKNVIWMSILEDEYYE